MDARAGEIAGLFASFAWAIGSLVYGRVQAPAASLNLFKNSVATLLFLASILVLSASRSDVPFHASREALSWLTLSSLVGLVAGDTCYFRSLQILGARRALVLTTFTPAFSAFLGWRILGENLPGLACWGIILTLLGVLWVILEGLGDPPAVGPYSGSVLTGTVYGFLGAICQALGAVWSKLGMKELEPLEASFFRLAIAAGTLLAFGLVSGRLAAWARILFAPGVPFRLAAAAALGTYLGIWSSLMAFKYTQVAVATTLTTLSPIFVIPLAWLFLGQRTPLKAILGAALAVSGVAILF